MVNSIIKLHTENHIGFENFLKHELPECITVLNRGGILVFPTETLYGLGVDITNECAIDRLIELKGRPRNMPIAVAVTDLKQVIPLAEITELATKIIKNCLPKPITILLTAKKTINPRLLGGSDLIGFRFPEHPVTTAIINHFGPITATSANLHNCPEPITIDNAIEQFGDRVDIYLDSGPCRFAKPSTVINTINDTIKIIRYGACSGTELEECLRGN